uniref:Uncharacterized protein n=1 Tax=Rhizophora mucronata TaxID=61149 RepID=A0A2P2Q2J8_RHIMU
MGKSLHLHEAIKVAILANGIIYPTKPSYKIQTLDMVL